MEFPSRLMQTWKGENRMPAPNGPEGTYPPGTEARRTLEIAILKAVCAGIEGIENMVLPAFFQTPGTRKTFRLLQDELDLRGYVDRIVVESVLKELNESTPEKKILADLFSDPPSPEDAKHFAERLRRDACEGEQARLKKLIDAIPLGPDYWERLSAILERTGEGSRSPSEAESLGTFLPAFLEEVDQRQRTGGAFLLGFDTGMQVLNRWTLGLDGIIVLAGRPGSGKSTLALQWGVDIARGRPEINRKPFPFLLYSFVMSRCRITAKIISRLTDKLSDNEILLGRVFPETLDKLTEIVRGQVSAGTLERLREETWDLVRSAGETLATFAENIRIYIPQDCPYGVTPDLIRDHIRTVKRQTGAERVFVAIDALHDLIAQPFFRDIGETPRERLDYLVPVLKEISESTRSAILLVSQRRRKVRGAAALDVFEGSTGVEYGADIVLNILMGEETGDADREKRSLHVTKQKYGKTVNIPLKYFGALSYFAEDEGEYPSLQFDIPSG
jgi:replicative DNA helicase